MEPAIIVYDPASSEWLICISVPIPHNYTLAWTVICRCSEAHRAKEIKELLDKRDQASDMEFE